MKQERVGVLIGSYKLNCLYFDACYEDYKDLINKTKEECKRRYKRCCLLCILLEDGTYLQKYRNRWERIDNRLPNEIITEVQ